MFRNNPQLVWIIAALVYTQFAAAGIWLVLRMLRRGRTFTCPSCKKEVDREAIRQDGILCPFCGWRAILPIRRQPDSSRSHVWAHAERACRRCGFEFAASEPGVLLWDDKVYCGDCVAGASPQLIDYAAQHDRLEEAMPYSAWRIGLRMFIFAEGACTAFLGTIFFLAGLNKAGILDLLEGLFLSQLLILPVALLYSVVPGRMYALNRPSVSVHSGRLTVRKGNVWSATHALGECQWFIDQASRSKILEKIILPGDRAILIALPHGPTEAETLVPVGFNDESRQRWEAFLTLAGMPRRTAWEKKAGLARKILSPIAALLALAGSLTGCVQLAFLVTRSLKAIGAPANVSEMVGLLTFLPGSIFVIVYIYLLWPWRLVPRVPTTRTPADQAILRRNIQWSTVIPCTFLATLAMLCGPNLDVTTRVVGIAIAALLSWIVATDFSRRIASTELATTLPAPLANTQKPDV